MSYSLNSFKGGLYRGLDRRVLQGLGRKELRLWFILKIKCEMKWRLGSIEVYTISFF